MNTVVFATGRSRRPRLGNKRGRTVGSDAEHRGLFFSHEYRRQHWWLVDAALCVKSQVTGAFVSILGGNAFRAALRDVFGPHREDRADATFLLRKDFYETASRHEACETETYSGTTVTAGPPDAPPSNLVMAWLDLSSRTAFHACHLVQPSDRHEYELRDTADSRTQSGRITDAVRVDGWRVVVGYPEDRVEAGRRPASEAETVSGTGRLPGRDSEVYLQTVFDLVVTHADDDG